MPKDEILDKRDRFLRKVHLLQQEGCCQFAFFKEARSGFFIYCQGEAERSACIDEINIELSKKQATQLRDDLNRYLQFVCEA